MYKSMESQLSGSNNEGKSRILAERRNQSIRFIKLEPGEVYSSHVPEGVPSGADLADI